MINSVTYFPDEIYAKEVITRYLNRGGTVLGGELKRYNINGTVIKIDRFARDTSFSKIAKLLNFDVPNYNLLHKSSAEVNKWLKQFETTEDRLLALQILKKFTYVDIKNARKGYRKLYQDLIKDGVDIEKTNFATLGNAKSASMMSYLFIKS